MIKLVFVSLVTILTTLSLASTSYSVQPSFKGIGFLPGSFPESEATGVSGDGKVIVGHSHNGGFWWSEETGMLLTTSSWGGSVSFDGSVVASTTRSWRAFRWTADTGVYSIVSDGIDIYTISNDISDDGSIIVGQTYGTGFVWKPGISYDSISSAKANGISADGTVVVGEKYTSDGSEAFKWDLSGQLTLLGKLQGSTNCKAHAISADKKIIVGESYWGSRNEAFLWNEEDGMTGLGYVPGTNRSWAKDISEDGRIVIGLAGTEAFIWDSQNGMRNLRLVLEQDYNLNLTGWKLDFAASISADGSVIVGRGTNPDGQREAWVAVIPKPATEVAVDIKPGSCPNPLNVNSKGVLPVAILGSEDLDINTIDVTSVRLVGIPPVRSSYEDVATPVSDANDCNCTTDGPDGYNDLTLKFKTQEVVEAIGEVDDGDVLMLELTGVLFGERPIEGNDCVFVRGKSKPFNKADFNRDGVVDMSDFAELAESWLK